VDEYREKSKKKRSREKGGPRAGGAGPRAKDEQVFFCFIDAKISGLFLVLWFVR